MPASMVKTTQHAASCIVSRFPFCHGDGSIVPCLFLEPGLTQLSSFIVRALLKSG
jgi:hypothetical protein